MCIIDNIIIHFVKNFILLYIMSLYKIKIYICDIIISSLTELDYKPVYFLKNFLY